jgi:hypothetical protein
MKPPSVTEYLALWREFETVSPKIKRKLQLHYFREKQSLLIIHFSIYYNDDNRKHLKFQKKEKG